MRFKYCVREGIFLIYIVDICTHIPAEMNDTNLVWFLFHTLLWFWTPQNNLGHPLQGQGPPHQGQGQVVIIEVAETAVQVSNTVCSQGIKNTEFKVSVQNYGMLNILMYWMQLWSCYSALHCKYEMAFCFSGFSSQYSRSRFSRQFSSPKDITECTAIVCSRIPSKCFNKEAIRTHFSQVARPTRIYVNNVKGTVIVHFEDHVSF